MSPRGPPPCHIEDAGGLRSHIIDTHTHTHTHTHTNGFSATVFIIVQFGVVCSKDNKDETCAEFSLSIERQKHLAICLFNFSYFII